MPEICIKCAKDCKIRGMRPNYNDYAERGEYLALATHIEKICPNSPLIAELRQRAAKAKTTAPLTRREDQTTSSLLNQALGRRGSGEQSQPSMLKKLLNRNKP